MKRVGLVMGLLTVPGCDRLFSVLEVKGVDALPDAPPSACWNPAYTWDEDFDGMIDGCDTCPADATIALADMDGDGIDDICDPNPAAPGDIIVDFDGFASQRGWEAQAGTWTIANGEQTAASSSSVSATELTVAPANHPVLDVIFTGDGSFGAYVLVGGGMKVACEHLLKTSPTPDEVVLTIDGQVASMADLDVGGGPARLQVGINRANEAFCRVSRNGGVKYVFASTGAGPTTARIGLIARLLGGTFKSVTLFGEL